MKEFHEVADPVWAESVFWKSIGIGDIPYRRGVEVENMERGLVFKGLEAAKKVGNRPQAPAIPDYVYFITLG